MKKVLIEFTEAQHARLHKIAEAIGRPAKHLIEGLLTEHPRLSEQEKRETLRALKLKKTDKGETEQTSKPNFKTIKTK